MQLDDPRAASAFAEDKFQVLLTESPNQLRPEDLANKEFQDEMTRIWNSIPKADQYSFKLKIKQ